jgi:FkbM family methyltransferase
MSVRLIFNSVWQNPGNRGQRLFRLGRAAAWQMEKRLWRRPRTVRLSNGVLFVAHPDCVVSSALTYANWPEFHELQFVRRFLQREDAIIDVGANVGHVSLLLSDLLTSENIFAFEPTPVSFRRLQENWRANAWPTTNLFQAAVGQSAGVVLIPDTSSPETKNAVAPANRDVAAVEVPLVSLDEYRQRWSGRRIGLLKIDVEGYEPQVLQGANQMLRSDRPRLIMFESLGGDVDATISATLANAGYAIFQLDQGGRPDFTRASSQNLFAVPTEERSALP